MSADPRTRMEALYRDVLGEAHVLVQQLQACSERVNQAVETLDASEGRLRRVLAEAGPDLRRQCEASMRDATTGVQTAARDVLTATTQLQRGSARMLRSTWLAGAAAGLISGLVSGLLGAALLMLTR